MNKRPRQHRKLDRAFIPSLLLGRAATRKIRSVDVPSCTRYTRRKIGLQTVDGRGLDKDRERERKRERFQTTTTANHA